MASHLCVLIFRPFLVLEVKLYMLLLSLLWLPTGAGTYTRLSGAIGAGLVGHGSTTCLKP